ncbi:MAG: pentapeptide repeat-containing protein [Dactylosporangium sp.]|nr:pentapeptide repeat-containing protein [Dactylosporangium sp.]
MTVFVAYMEMVESQERVEIAQQQLDQQATLTLKEQYAQRFNNGAGGLKETSTEAKIAAIAQLEQVAADAMNESIPDDERATATRYREPAVRVISAYARSASRVPVSEIPSYGNDPEQTPLLGFRLPEVQFAVEALSRINQDGQVPLDLTQVDLIRAQLPDAHLARAVLTGARMQGADLTKADLTKAVLRGADLRGAGLDGAIVTDVNCSGALIDDRTSGPAECLGSATKITGSITSPKYGTTVPHVVTLQGETVADVEAFGFQLWVAVVPHPAATPSDDDRYYPHRQAVLAGEPSDSGPPQWSLEGVTLGQPDEVGMRFDLALVLADGKATKVIEGYLSQPNPPGMKFLPVGAVVLDKVAVTRG